MPGSSPHTRPEHERCIYLFVSLLGFIMLLPFLNYIPYGRALAHALQWLILLTALVTIGRSWRMLVVGLCIIVPAFLLFWLGAARNEHFYLLLSRLCTIVFYFITITTLLNYVLLESVMNTDRLYGAACIYLMLGILWAFLYSLLLEHNPTSLNNFTANRTDPVLSMVTLIYFSFTTLTTTGYGDISPAGPMAQMLAAVEQIIGTLFVAILIARLVGFYSPPQDP